MTLVIKPLLFADIKKASDILTANFVDDKGIVVLFEKSDHQYQTKVNAWFSATLNMLITNKQPINGAYIDNELAGISVATHNTFKPSFTSMIQWVFTVLFSCGLGTVIKSAKHDQQRQSSFTSKNQYILEFIAVNPTHRRKGVGKKLFSNLHRLAKAAKAAVWLETTKETNIKIFEKINYHLVRTKSELSVEYYIMTNEGFC